MRHNPRVENRRPEAGIALAVGVGAVLFTWAGGLLSARIWPADPFASSAGALALLLASQGLLLALTAAGTFASAEPTRIRLGFGPSRLPVWSYPFLAFGGFSINVLSENVLRGIGFQLGGGDQVVWKLLWIAVNEPGIVGLAAIGVIVLVGPLIEEALFRGVVLRGLMHRWSSWMAIATTSGLFALMHGGRAPIVFAAGLWSTVVAWRAASIRPAVACHVGNNLLYVLVMRAMEDPSASVTLPGPGNVAAVVGGAVSLAVSADVLRVPRGAD